MTVEQLIDRLMDFPLKATVIVNNTSVYEDGEYRVTEVIEYDKDHVEIASNYDTMVE